jgi:hypothetical protein
VRVFATFTEDLERLTDWLEQCGVTTVALESTAVYWIPLFEILEKMLREFEPRVDPAERPVTTRPETKSSRRKKEKEERASPSRIRSAYRNL